MSPVAPAMFVLSPLLPDNWTMDQLGPEVCLATGFRPKEGEMVLNLKGGAVNVSTSSAVMSKQLKSYVFAGFINQTIHSCELHGASANNEADDPCTNFYPEKAKLNFFLLVMNGVRLVFAKTLAFNTLLTIRALIL